ncbi:GFA family protein [Dyella sp. C11]|uniref:GFA family protein n=1 Tax=Dyella sp. C11 TaxID=2126991 RepID=UPI000D65D483|nr:GFA family protein [Dyella sp. C11]
MKGSCHCGNVQFTVDGEPNEVMSCNCSMCQRKGALLWFVPREQFHLHTSNVHTHSYLFNKHVIQHIFCTNCGIHAYCEGTGPDGKPMAAINVRCLEGIDLDALPVRHYDGRSR